MSDNEYTKRRERIAARLLSGWISDPNVELGTDDSMDWALVRVLTLTDKLIEKLDEQDREGY